MDLGVIAMKGYSTFSKAILKPDQSDCLVSYPEHLLVESYSFVEMQSVYPAAPVDWARSLV